MFNRLKSLIPILVLALVLWSIINVVRQPNRKETSLWNKALKLVGIGASPQKEAPRSLDYVPGKLKQAPTPPPASPRGEPAGEPTPASSPSIPPNKIPPPPPPLPKLPPPGSSLGVNSRKPLSPPPLPLKTSAPIADTSVVGTLKNFFDSVVESIIGK
ncbi:hypothetical protein A2697_03060 [Candidatus Curtissbacteria bacterium RIFCSPHIGHO2_01_FULL_41_44]|uniref:Uncharacterized protein n=1 Tax=Candidatus Curtissbacteria bacterium RIFCSPLOWO2_01_FULL_42_50 TaxID=1797730 RepID=A0A1F5H4Q0_9BACT|nr:MAG: hypothetical protein A2697_03060 [Candidatus Curtissbacteria bacterium RIFCSPHIGHO2_01_FULL_41_44]OGD93860.1 MAG: hypothetical protein A3C33_01370 [Candidatus Curtissbacteria bacterium RIFCSPHIGHO2_02_FULL_42_58]OGD99123.1 MAG: hypothetical protein A3B54_02825 [Candidatus Curtissbacteria bacterium RIFCSPLOWO2_01_FULL_42_50]OGE09936.1 MAG: hypothetical protein A3H87_04610 [Candidatus Curtissbacteria bacterium RIFCSPLOWO2_02_FULL_42_37]